MMICLIILREFINFFSSKRKFIRKVLFSSLKILKDYSTFFSKICLIHLIELKFQVQVSVFKVKIVDDFD